MNRRSRRSSFNPRSHAGSDGRGSQAPSPRCKFQSTLPRGERLPLRYLSVPSNAVSIHAPTRGATRLLRSVSARRAVSIHAPTRGATRAQVRRVLSSLVSIHAPTRGATVMSGWQVRTGGVSIHAPTRGATVERAKANSIYVFQSTLPRGERRENMRIAKTQYDVSIHAPTRGATMAQAFKTDLQNRFNPRSHAGSDSCCSRDARDALGFNPRSHAGSDALSPF